MQESDGAAGTQPETGDNRAKVMCAAFVDRRRANYSQTMLKLRVGMEKLVGSNGEPHERGVCGLQEQAHRGGRVVPCYSFSQDFERHSGLRSAQLLGPLVIPLLKACCHLMPQRSHASYAALLSAQKGEKLAGRKCEKWGKTGWVGVYYFSSMTAALFSTQARTERFYKWEPL